MRARGLSLIEVIIAMAILVVVILAVTAAIAGGLRITRDSQRSAAANSYAQAVLEEYRGHWTNAGNYNNSISPNLSDHNGKLLAGFNATVNLDCLSEQGADLDCAAGIPPLRTVTVQVTDSGKVRASVSTRIGNPTP